MRCELKGKVTAKSRPFQREGQEASVRVTVFDEVTTTDVYVPQTVADSLSVGARVALPVSVRGQKLYIDYDVDAVPVAAKAGA